MTDHKKTEEQTETTQQNEQHLEEESSELQEGQTEATQEEVEETAELSEEENLQSQVQQLTDALAKAQADLLRERAELENFKRRSAKANSESLKYASTNLVKELLPVLDSLEKAIDSSQNEEASVDSIREGIEMVYKMAQDAMIKNGVLLTNPVGEAFDPNQHQAVGMVNSEEVAENHIVDVLQKGYMLYDRVIRAAMVRVCQK